MFLNIIFMIILSIILTLFLANHFTEGYQTIISPKISYSNQITNNPINTYYRNMKISQDFDPNSVFTTFHN